METTPTPSPTRDSPFNFGEESSRAELSLKPRSRPSTAPLEREVELLKIEVAHWQGHCLEAKQHKVVANWLGIASSTTGS